MVFKPYPYQAWAIERVINQAAVGLFFDMGLGKTAIALTAIDRLRYDRWEVSRCLIIAPKKVAEATWQNEAARWDHLGRLKINTVLGTAKQRERALWAPGDIWVINRENVPWLVDYYKHAWPFDMVVIDESSSFKNSRSLRFRKLKLVRDRITRLVELTGTPAPNGLEDLWAQVYLLDGGARLGRTLTSFRDEYFTEDYAYPGQTYRTYTARPFSEKRIEKALSDICVSMKAEDYLTLPDMIEDDIPVILDPAARKAYDRFEREMLLDIDEDEITAGSAAVLTGKLLQFASGAVYDAEHLAHEVHRAKIDAFLETVEQIAGHVLVFYAFRHDLERLKRALAATGLKVRAYRGPEDERDWNAGKIDVLLAHPASCAYGLNLQQGGHHLVWFTLTWSLEQYQQANKRLHRQGQEKPVIVHRLICVDSVDESVAAALAFKGETQGALVRALKARIRQVRQDA